MLQLNLIRIIAPKQDAQPRVQWIVLSDRRKMRHLMPQLARLGLVLAPEVASATFWMALTTATSAGKKLR